MFTFLQGRTPFSVERVEDPTDRDNPVDTCSCLQEEEKRKGEEEDLIHRF